MGQCWERSLPTDVSRVQFSNPASCVDWVCCWFSSLLQEVLLRVIRFSQKLNQLFHIPIVAWKVSPVSARALNSLTVKIKAIIIIWHNSGKLNHTHVMYMFCSFIRLHCCFNYLSVYLVFRSHIKRGCSLLILICMLAVPALHVTFLKTKPGFSSYVSQKVTVLFTFQLK